MILRVVKKLRGIKIMEKYWSRFQDTYDEKQEYVVGKEILTSIKEELNFLPDIGEVVELGCGTGYFSEVIAQKAIQLVATDLSDELLESAKARLKTHPNISIQKENCLDTSFPSEKFDSVFMANLIHVIENPQKVLEESRRILKCGGVLIIVTYTNYGMKLFETIKLGLRFLRGWGKPPQHVHTFSPGKLALLIEKAGFQVEKSKLIGDRTKALYLIGKKK